MLSIVPGLSGRRASGWARLAATPCKCTRFVHTLKLPLQQQEPAVCTLLVACGDTLHSTVYSPT